MSPSPDIDTESETKQTVTISPDAAAQEEGFLRRVGSKFLANSVFIFLLLISVCAILLVAELGSLVSFANKNAQSGTIIGQSPTDNVPGDLPPALNSGENVCEGKKPDLPDVDCIVDALQVGPQSGANVTAGYTGNMTVDHDPITTPFWMNGMCPVNVHWHLGAEHLSVGQYDENGSGPSALVHDETIRFGHQCNLYDASDSKFTRPYYWKYCKSMEVGQTYEVHWPHSAAGACGTPNQYQTPFYDGVFCTDEVLTDTASQVGVESQIFIVVNDEEYFWPDLMRGMIVDGEMGTDVAKYTGSTTGDSRSNEICSQYTPITWHVDRKCHMISASAFDKLCYDMLQQRDDMSGDIHPHGARETVDDSLAADNQVRRYYLRT